MCFFKLEFKPGVGGGFLRAFTSQKGPGKGLPASGFARGRPRGQPIRAPGAERMEAWARGGKFCLLRLLWCSHVACYAVRSARFHRMAPRSEPLGSRPAPWLKTRHWHQIAFQAARTRAVIISGIEADSGSTGCLRRRSEPEPCVPQSSSWASWRAASRARMIAT